MFQDDIKVLAVGKIGKKQEKVEIVDVDTEQFVLDIRYRGEIYTVAIDYEHGDPYFKFNNYKCFLYTFECVGAGYLFKYIQILGSSKEDIPSHNNIN